MDGANRMLPLLTVFMLLPSCFSTKNALRTSYEFEQMTNLAAGTLSCAANEVVEIVSVGYRYNSRECRLNCSRIPDRPAFFNGSSTECRNEENIRSTCYARSSCTIANITRPSTACGQGNNLPSHVEVYYRCISSNYVFNLCEERSGVITEETSITFTTPFTPADGYFRSACKCSLRSRFNNQTLSEGLNITRVKMAQFRDNDQLCYEYKQNGEQSGGKIIDGVRYNMHYLLDERVVPFSNYASDIIDIFPNRQHWQTNSRVFITVQPDKDIIVECNGAFYSTPATSQTSSPVHSTRPSIEATQTSGAVFTRDSLTGTANITADSSGSNTTLSSTPKSPNTLIIGLVVSLVLVCIICAIIIVLFCLKSRSWRRKRRAEQQANGRSNNNNATMKLLNSPVQEIPADTVYHELEKQEDPYDVISVDEDDDSHTAGATSPPSSADPYKVSNLPDLSVEMNASRLKPVDQFRNSRGSIDVYTENSTITDNVYSEPCDVDQTEGSSPRSRKYDEPANVTYAEVQKPAKTTGVELIDNELYGT